MLEAIEDRELIVLDGLGDRIHGTLHRPAEREDGDAPDSPATKRTGVLFLNSLSLPRAASGDSAVYWASAMAAQGYPAFRIDLPGLGDSEGSSSQNLLNFINAGGFAAPASAAIDQLVERFGLSGMVLFGHCAGSVSAVYAAAANPYCRGLILLDPYFHLPQARRSPVREGLSGWARRSALGRLLSNAYDRARNFRLLLRGSQPPANANTELLAHWKRLAATGLPILLLKAPGIKAQGAKPRIGEFDYFHYAVKLAGRNSRVAAEFVESADHSFANREGRAAVQVHTCNWLAAHFPLTDVPANQTGAAGNRGAQTRSIAHGSNRPMADRACAIENR